MTRPSLFEDEDASLLSEFKPKTGHAPAPSGDEIRQTARAGGFGRPTTQQTQPQPRAPMTYRTGRTQTFAVKTLPSAVDRFYAMAQRNGWKVSETFERAVDALEREQGPV